MHHFQIASSLLTLIFMVIPLLLALFAVIVAWRILQAHEKIAQSMEQLAQQLPQALDQNRDHTQSTNQNE
ncbi:hypothetical protein [Marininema halotolerans]|uniref:Uncharacterized protein n=1 Tax=Marininema halotolerans TaxID=1155944 RepID=A0A1I6QH96_9BACL|nr:hypothetical protein [Marininema halotolerans]SFS51688.1 hypothetical protein SAMN05444972_103146 [Marininema halotolerans]